MNRRKFLCLSMIGGVELFLRTPKIFADETIDNKIDVFLTIDDGPGKYMEKIINNLGDNNLATFFLIGNQVNKETLPVLHSALEMGHNLGNHSFTHPFFSEIGINEAKGEIEKTHKIINKIYDTFSLENPCLFRFPYGDVGNRTNKEYIKKFLEEKGYRTFFWDVDTEDWRYYSKKHKKNLVKIMQNCIIKRDKSIILTHDLGITADYIIPSLIKEDRYLFRKLI